MLRDFHRGRRLRQSPELRALVRDTPPLLAEELIMPYFVVETDDSHFRKEISVSETQGKEEMAERIKTLMTRENFIKWINNAIERGENYCIPFAQADIIVDRILNDARKYGHIIEVPRDKRNNYAKIVI